jgi:hypothetical protein
VQQPQRAPGRRPAVHRLVLPGEPGQFPGDRDRATGTYRKDGTERGPLAVAQLANNGREPWLPLNVRHWPVKSYGTSMGS